ncbi:ferredoxin:thioredoxin reductase [Desulfovibrio sp. OttesenSCG-928-M14]|nr:ferredoxin:thioredoxin reductase [Desulfovibrio sp. OttesenSCG-928-M14]
MNSNPVRPELEEEVQKLHDTLKKLQEPRGYFFNNDDSLTWPLLKELLVTKARYGYMACPCRIANGSRELDKDIICPCTYREEDVKEYGACFCGLYVKQEWNEGAIPKVYVPERRPPEKIQF